MVTRKKFLRQALATGAGLYLSQSAFASIVLPQKKEKLGVALVGLGYYSSDLLAPALQLTNHCELKGIVTGTPSKADVEKDISDCRQKYLQLSKY